MAKPVLMAIDDDAQVLRAVERDLRRHYGSEYRVLRADSGRAALDALRQLKLRDEAVGLLLSDQRMPDMSGVEFLEASREFYPDTKRALLTAYADTDAAIRAINGAQIDYYLMKPWDPPEEQFYPVLDDLLSDWKSHHRPPFEGVRVIGHRFSRESHAIKDFLGRNQVPYEWLDLAANVEAQKLIGELGEVQLPLVLFPDGTRLEKPEPRQVAERVGLQVKAELPFYDLAIIGGGPAGLAAAVYGASEGLQTLMIDREAPGGQAGTSSRIENYLGFPSGLSGADLARRAVAQAKRFGVEILAPVEVCGVRAEGPYRIIKMTDGTEVSCHALLIATGVSWRKLNAPGIERLTGQGVYYGAAQTEAIACKNEDVYIIGGANSAGQGAMYFSQYARSVTILVRGEGLAASMSQYLIDQIASTPNITVRPFCQVKEAHGQDNLEAITIINKDGSEERVEAGALCIFIGAEPFTDFVAGVVERDDKGFILAGPDLMPGGKNPKDWPLERPPFLLECSVPGIFVAGDVMHGSVKRVASAVGGGSIAVQFVHQYLAQVR